MDKIIVFGASGDLAKNKIMPALSNIYNENVKVYAYARSDMKDSYSKMLRDNFDYSNDFPEKIEYIMGQYDNLESLRHIIDKKTIIYLSLPPSVYPLALSNLSGFEVGAICIEKPYGESYLEFEELMKFRSDSTLFIDHYLLKPMVKSIFKIENQNRELFDLLNKNYIGNVECYFIEKILANSRSYFDNTGIVKDVMQNHLTEILATVLCDKPSLNFSSQRCEIIKKMEINHVEAVFGQYRSYCAEMISKSGAQICSLIETFACFSLEVNTDKWSNIPFTMIAGKAMDRKATEIVFNVKKTAFKKFTKYFPKLEIEKSVEIKIKFNISPLNEISIECLCENAIFEYKILNSNEIEDDCPGAYECLFYSLIENKFVPTISFEEAEALWKLYQKLIESKKLIFYYKEGINLPEQAESHFNRSK